MPESERRPIIDALVGYFRFLTHSSVLKLGSVKGDWGQKFSQTFAVFDRPCKL